MFDDVNALIKSAREAEDEAARLLKKKLPPGTLVTFRFGNMTLNSNAEVVSTSVIHYPQVQLRNEFTGKIRRVPLSAIQGVFKELGRLREALGKP